MSKNSDPINPHPELWKAMDELMPYLRERFQDDLPVSRTNYDIIAKALRFGKRNGLIPDNFQISKNQVDDFMNSNSTIDIEVDGVTNTVKAGYASEPAAATLESVQNCFPQLMAHWQFQEVFRYYNRTILFRGEYIDEGNKLKQQNRQTKLLKDLWVYIPPKGNYHELSATAGTPTDRRWMPCPKPLDALLVDWMNGDADQPLSCNITRRMAIVLGAPGTGKSFLCRQLIRLLYPNHIFNGNLPFIYYFRLRELGTLFEFIDREKEKNKKKQVDEVSDVQPDEKKKTKETLLAILGRYITQEAFEKEQAVHSGLKHPVAFQPFTVGKSLIILDGLDEWEIIEKDKRKIIDFLNELNECLSKQPAHIPVRCLVTSRSFLLNEEKKSALDDQEKPAHNLFEKTLVLELSLMENGDQIKWLEDYREVMDWGDRYGLTTAKLKIYQDKTDQFPHLRELLGTPVLLNILTILHDQEQADFELPEHKTDLYTKLIDFLVKREWDPKGKHRYSPTPKTLRELLQEIAYHMYQNNSFFIDHADILRIQREKISHHPLNLRDSESPIGVILLSYFFQEDQKSDGAYEIAHASFRDYLIAEALIERLKKEEVLMETGNQLLIRFHDLFGQGKLSENSEKDFTHLIQSEINRSSSPPLSKLRNHLRQCLGDLLKRDFMPDQVQSDHPIKTALRIFYNYWFVLMHLHSSKKEREELRWTKESKLEFLKLYGLLQITWYHHYLDVAHLEFQGLNLNNQSFRYNFSNYVLEGIDFSKSILDSNFFDHSTLRKSQLRGTSFSEAYLHGVDFEFSDLTDAILSFCELTNTNFYGATLEHAQFEHSIINNTQFDYANLRSAIFEKSVIQFATFKWTDITGIDFSDTSFYEVDLSRANWWDATFSENVRGIVFGFDQDNPVYTQFIPSKTIESMKRQWEYVRKGWNQAIKFNQENEFIWQRHLIDKRVRFEYDMWDNV
jgi:uncharacterized protein YjbI with pentapeptide repeats/adenylate kinase family enzyme